MGRSATGQNGQPAAKKDVSAMWSGGWMSENISGVPAGRSVFHLTSPFIGLTKNCYSTQFVPASTPLASVASASGVQVPRGVRISASLIAIPRKGQWVIVKRYPLSCLGNSGIRVAPIHSLALALLRFGFVNHSLTGVAVHHHPDPVRKL